MNTVTRTNKHEDTSRPLQVHAWNGLLPKLEEKKTADFFVADATRHRYVMTDGATKARYARDWSQMLAEYACKHLPNKGMDHEQWLESSRMGWPTLVAQRQSLAADAPPAGVVQRQSSSGKRWFIRRKDDSADGAATLLALWFDTDDIGKPHWYAAAVGDTCLFWIRRGELKLSFPCTKSDEFTTHPDLLFSVKDQGDGTFKWDDDTLEAGDVFLLATDGLAQWLLKKHEQNKPQWSEMVRLADAGDDGAFRRRMDAERLAERMEDDDISLAVIRVKQCPAENAKPVEEIKEMKSPVAAPLPHDDEPTIMVDRFNKGNSDRDWKSPIPPTVSPKPRESNRPSVAASVSKSSPQGPAKSFSEASSWPPSQPRNHARPPLPKGQPIEAPAPEPERIPEYPILPRYVRELLVPAMVAAVVSIGVTWWKIDESRPPVPPATKAPSISTSAAQRPVPGTPATGIGSSPAPSATPTASSSASSSSPQKPTKPPATTTSKPSATVGARPTTTPNPATNQSTTQSNDASTSTSSSSGAPSQQHSVQDPASPATTAKNARSNGAPAPSQPPPQPNSNVPSGAPTGQTPSSRNNVEAIGTNRGTQNAHPMSHVNPEASLVLP